ncbi:DUF1146 family protein [Staphylococcus epidermidis]
MKLHQFFKNPYPLQLQLSIIFISILLPTPVSNFILDLFQYSTQLKYFIK